MSIEKEAGVDMVPVSDVVLEWTHSDSTQGTVCALLTPAIKAKLREMAPGQVLEVRVNDLTAREDIASWCRLSGNELVAMTEEPQQVLRAYLRKKRT